MAYSFAMAFVNSSFEWDANPMPCQYCLSCGKESTHTGGELEHEIIKSMKLKLMYNYQKLIFEYSVKQ